MQPISANFPTFTVGLRMHHKQTVTEPSGGLGINLMRPNWTRSHRNSCSVAGRQDCVAGSHLSPLLGLH